jgi:phosphoglycolate phosphatase
MDFDPRAVRGLLFDLDGTLIDSTADLAASGNWLRRQQGLDALSAEQIGSYVGDGAESMVRRLLNRPEGDLGSLVEDYKRYYNEHCLEQTRLYPGVGSTLEQLRARGYKMAVVTNKPERISKRILDGLNVGACFGSVIGGNTCVNKKPHPEPLLLACAQLGLEPGAFVMIGDSRVDVEAGHNAGMPSAGILGGIGAEDLLRAAGPDLLLERFTDLLDKLPSLQAGYATEL